MSEHLSAGPLAFFTHDHRRCDALWLAVEEATDGGDATAARDAFERFDQAVRTHLAMEEEVLFPAFEEVTGMHGGGPTQVMRFEHSQMRGVLDQMAAALADGDLDELVDQGDTLLMLIQQHNAKEEGMLYPMAQRVLALHWDGLAERLAPYLGS